MFFTIEGLDGSGKTTFAKALVEELKALDIPVVHTRELGGTDFAENVRELVLSDPTANPLVDLLLAFSARLDHVDRLIVPIMEMGSVVICERFIDSTYAYQLADPLISRNDYAIKAFDAIEAIVNNKLPEYQTFYLEVDLDTIRTRIADRSLDRFEDDLDLQKRLKSAFLERMAKEPKRFIVLDQQGNLENLNVMAREWALEIKKRYQNRKG